MRIVFMGTPDFAVLALRKLHEAGHEIVLVVTQPDKPKGRSKLYLPSPVKEEAMRLGIEVFQPDRIKKEENVEEQHPNEIQANIQGEGLSPKQIDKFDKTKDKVGHRTFSFRYPAMCIFILAIIGGFLTITWETMPESTSQKIDATKIMLQKVGFENLLVF